MLCLSGFELYSRWVPLILYQGLAQSLEEVLGIVLDSIALDIKDLRVSTQIFIS